MALAVLIVQEGEHLTTTFGSNITSLTHQRNLDLIVLWVYTRFKLILSMLMARSQK